MRDTQAAKDERSNRHMLGALRLIDLWEGGQLEGFMSLDGHSRMSAGLSGDEIVFLGPDCRRMSFPKETTVTLKNDTVEFTGESPTGVVRKFKLTLGQAYNPL